MRATAGLTQQAAAELAEIETKHWQVIESGRSNPTLATLVAVAAAFKTDLATLLR